MNNEIPDIAELLKQNIEEGSMLIANPGTGKTTALANKVIELIENGVEEQEILCITFTEKAASEMRERIERKIMEKSLRVEPTKIRIHTFHSYAYESLMNEGMVYDLLGNNIIRFSIYKYFENNKLNYSNEYIISEIIPKVENAIRYVKSFGITPDIIDIEKVKQGLENIYITKKINNITLEENMKFLEYFITAYKMYETEKPVGYIDYNDMLIKFLKLKHKKIFKYVLVDELQDVNELEATVALSSGKNIFLVGDRKQSIFGFQGGSIKNFELFAQNEKIKIGFLYNNYRSGQPILNYAKEYFLKHTKNKEEYEKELRNLKNDNKIETSIELITTNNPEICAVDKAVKLLNSDDSSVIAEKSIAIICRTNAQIIKISKILASKSVEYSTTTGTVTSEEAKREIITFMKGIFYDDVDNIITALFTPFSGLSLKEAFQINEAIKEKNYDINLLAKDAMPFFDIKDRFKTVPQLLKLFEEIIFPVAVSIGRDYYITAKSISDGMYEFINTVPKPSITDFFNYLSLVFDNYNETGKKRGIVLTTVHKAKGLEFDRVIYIPAESRAALSFIDACVHSIITTTTNFDIEEELEEEPLRIDFVAFTRAKRALYIIIKDNQRLLEKYSAENIDKKNIIMDEVKLEPMNQRYVEAFSLFVNKRYDEAKKMVNVKDIWIKELIHNYFTRIDNLSYSKIKSIGNLYDFFKETILGIRTISKDLKLGREVHKMAFYLFKKTLNEDTLTEDMKSYLNNIKKIITELKEKHHAEQISAEEDLTIDLGKLAETLPDNSDVLGLINNLKKNNMRFLAKLDAVYKTDDNKYIIIDYKIDKTTRSETEHRRQLEIYRRVYALYNNININDIKIAIAFVGLKGYINTDKLDYKLNDNQPSEKNEKDLMSTFKKYLEQILKYMETPDKFIDDLVNSNDDNKNNNELLFKRIISMLTNYN